MDALQLYTKTLLNFLRSSSANALSSTSKTQKISLRWPLCWNVFLLFLFFLLLLLLLSHSLNNSCWSEGKHLQNSFLLKSTFFFISFNISIFFPGRWNSYHGGIHRSAIVCWVSWCRIHCEQILSQCHRRHHMVGWTYRWRRLQFLHCIIFFIFLLHYFHFSYTTSFFSQFIGYLPKTLGTTWRYGECTELQIQPGMMYWLSILKLVKRSIIAYTQHILGCYKTVVIF